MRGQDAANHRANGDSRVQKPTTNPKDKNESPQQARKRALDRQAQRNFRKKTKDYIAQLEKTVETFRAQNDSELVQRLWSQIAELRAENERQAKLLSDISMMISNPLASRSASSTEIRAQGWASGESDAGNGSNISAIGLPPNNPPDFARTQQKRYLAERSYQERTAFAEAMDGRGDQMPPERHADETTSLTNGSDETVSLDDLQFSQLGQLIPYNAENGGTWSSPMLQHLGQFGQSMYTSVPRLLQLPPRSTSFPCNSWATTLDIFGKVFEISKQRAVEARNVEEGAIFKGIKEGWNTLTTKQQCNPVIQIIREYDERFDIPNTVNRIAIAYKNHMMVKYFLNADPDDLERMPQWLRPNRASRPYRKYGVGLDLFPWPVLRERFICGHTDVYATDEFASAYLKNYCFAWPFSFEETFKCDSLTGKYTPSPLFKRYHSDIRFWKMEPAFFEKYPELAKDMNAPNPLEIGLVKLNPNTMKASDSFDITKGVYNVSSPFDNPNMFSQEFMANLEHPSDVIEGRDICTNHQHPGLGVSNMFYDMQGVAQVH